MIRRILSHARTIKTMGFPNWLRVVLRRPLRSQYAQYPLEFRHGTSDLSVFRQVFCALEYACVPGLAPKFILDCGANVGYASAYFLSRFPDAEVMAIEPDPGNFAVLARNLAPYRTRARAVQGAVWSHATRLSMAIPDYRSGEEWARQVREGGDDLPAYSIADLLRMADRKRADILKMDIEGTEAWIDQVNVIAIELHDDTSFGPASESVARATGGFDSFSSGELTIYRRRELAQ